MIKARAAILVSSLLVLGLVVLLLFAGRHLQQRFTGSIHALAERLDMHVQSLNYQRRLLSGQGVAELQGAQGDLQVRLQARFLSRAQPLHGRLTVESGRNAGAPAKGGHCPAALWIDTGWQVDWRARLHSRSRRACGETGSGDSSAEWALRLPLDFDPSDADKIGALNGHLSMQLTRQTLYGLMGRRPGQGAVQGQRRWLRAQLQFLLVQRILLRQGDYFVMDANIADGLMQVNGVEYPVPVLPDRVAVGQ